MNLYALPALPLEDELTEILAGSDNVRFERIISTGQTSSWYDQDEGEYVFLLKGEAEIAYEDKPSVHLKEGDWFYIPPHEKHRVAYTSCNPPCIWLCVFCR